MGSFLHNWCKGIGEFFLSILCLLLFLFVLVPTIFVAFVPIYLWRLFIILYVKLFRKDIVKIMGGVNPFMTIDDIHGRPLCTIVGMGAFDAADVESCKEFAKSSVFAVSPETKKLFNPTMQQYYEEWLGFVWWKQEEAFDISEHISVWEESRNKVVAEDDLINIVGILEAAPFPKKKSPWEMVLIANTKLNGVANPDSLKTIVMFRFHHGFADGIGIMQLLMRAVFTDSFEKVAKPIFVERNAFQQRMHQVHTGIQLPYQFLKQGILAMDVNDWHLPESRLTRKIHKAWSSRIPVPFIKEIKLKHNVGFTSVLFCAITGALRKMMVKMNVPVPDKMHAILPLPWPGHPPKLTNHWSYGYVELPIGTPSTTKRLEKLHRQIQKMKKSPVPAINFVMMKFGNLLPTWLLSRVGRVGDFPTIILSNFPGPPANSQGVGGFPLVDTMFTGGPLRGSVGISICILSYDGGLRIVTGIDSAILPSQTLTKQFTSLIEEEFIILRDSEASLTTV